MGTPIEDAHAVVSASSDQAVVVKLQAEHCCLLPSYGGQAARRVPRVPHLHSLVVGAAHDAEVAIVLRCRNKEYKR